MTPSVRFRVDFGGGCSVGMGKIDLLEGIARFGSLARAARQMRMSYRRAWLLLEDMNTSFGEPVSRSSVGGRGGGGATLTPLGARLVAAYRLLESQVQPLASDHLRDFSARVTGSEGRRSVKRVLRGARAPYGIT